MLIRSAAAALLLVCTFVGCSCQPIPRALPVSSYESIHGFTVTGPVSREDVEKFDRLLSKIDPKIVAAIASVTVTDNADYGGESYVGLCDGSGEISVRPTHFHNPVTIWHEAVHAYHFSLGCRRRSGQDCAFGIEFRKAAGDVYGKKYSWNAFPTQGLLDEYSSTDYFEDVATMTTDAYCYQNGEPSVLRRLQALHQLKKDPRYVRKLRLLAKYGFISQRLCDEILK
ncbi:MAG: hypothetical protein AAB345_01795 [Patescibacteria group bacterium]